MNIMCVILWLNLSKHVAVFNLSDINLAGKRFPLLKQNESIKQKSLPMFRLRETLNEEHKVCQKNVEFKSRFNILARKGVAHRKIFFFSL